MKLLFLSTENPFPADHGHHIRTFHTLKALAREYRIYFICFSQNRQGFDFRGELEKYCEAVYIFDIRRSKIHVMLSLIRNLFSNEPFVISRYSLPQTTDCITQLTREHKFDLVHIDMLHLSSYRKYFVGIPTVLVNHNVESLRMRRWASAERNYLLKLYLCYQQHKMRIYESGICRCFDRCIAVSEYDRKILTAMCGFDRFEVVPNGVDTDFFKVTNERMDPLRLVWTGSLRSPYNRDAVRYFFENIWPSIQRKIPETAIDIVGALPSGWRMGTLSKEPNIYFRGYVKDVRPFVSNASVFIAPIRSGSGTKIKILNAMAQGRAVVTTSIGLEGIEAIPEEEILVADDPRLFAEKTIFLLQNPGKTKEIGFRARKVIEEKYNRKNLAHRLNQIYRNLIYEFSDSAVPQVSRQDSMKIQKNSKYLPEDFL